MVKTLTNGLEKKNHHVFFDNFFTSVKLLKDMEKDGIYGCGTVRRDRKGLPPQLKNPELKKRCVCVCTKGVCRSVCVCTKGVCRSVCV